MRETEKIWMNGEFDRLGRRQGPRRRRTACTTARGVFEGIRCYETRDGPAVFRLREHLERLHNSARLLYMELPYSVDELRTATHELIGAQRAAGVLCPPVRVLRLRRAGRRTRRATRSTS